MPNREARMEEKGATGHALVRESYAASLSVLRAVVPFLTGSGGMAGRLTRGVTAVPRLVAASLCGGVPAVRRGHVLAEASLHCREAVVMLSYCRDLHGRFINGALCAELIETYRTIEAELGRAHEGREGRAEAQP